VESDILRASNVSGLDSRTGSARAVFGTREA